MFLPKVIHYRDVKFEFGNETSVPWVPVYVKDLAYSPTEIITEAVYRSSYYRDYYEYKIKIYKVNETWVGSFISKNEMNGKLEKIVSTLNNSFLTIEGIWIENNKSYTFKITAVKDYEEQVDLKELGTYKDEIELTNYL